MPSDRAAPAYLAYRLIEVPGRACFGRLAKRIDIRKVEAAVPPLRGAAERAP